MRFEKSLLKLCSIFALAAVLGLASVPADATPLPPALGVPVAGESDLGSYAMPNPAENITIDWMVVSADPFFGGAYAGQYAYLYQVENTTLAGNEIDLFTVSFDASVTVSKAGVLAVDLDTAFNHDQIAFPYLAGEEEGFAYYAPAAAGITTNVNATNVSWMFNIGFFLAPGFESNALYLISPNLPGYVVGQVANTSPPSPWGSLAANSDMVVGPVPVPEPGAVTLFGVGLLLAGASLRRSRR